MKLGLKIYFVNSMFVTYRQLKRSTIYLDKDLKKKLKNSIPLRAVS